ncbi:MAG: FAD-dependent oxidoreductase [Desulfobacterales bacterium]|jgi:NADPH-dependent glutamate synthase beta subunit-like oxidoreductase
MTEAIFMLGGIGIVVGIVLAAASKIFYVYVDPKILSVEDVLPGANCGGCGLPGCSANAEAIVAGRAAPNSCVAAGEDVAMAIAGILGVSVEAKEPDIARPGCFYGPDAADIKYLYDGVRDCRAVALLGGGMKVCSIGCLGLGSCARACPFDAIVMGPDGLPVVDEVKCTGCGTCERVCPKHIITLSSVTRRILREYTTDECTTPCQRACPAGINIREYIRQITLGDYHRSVQVIKERNPFPTVIGRICPRPCELECRRQYSDESVAINFLKRYVADYEMETGQHVQPFKAPDTGRSIAVVGGGVQGLSTAFFSARLGHHAMVYDGMDQLGGLLRSAISRYRLSHDVLDWDIQGILEMGVEAKTGQVLGEDFTIPGLLKEGHQAVFLATGGWDSRLARGEAGKIEMLIPDTYLLIDFIRGGRADGASLSVGKRIVFVGGGNLLSEAAAIGRRLGAESVTVLLRESVEEAPLTAETAAALEAEGVTVVFSAGLIGLFGDEDGVTSVETIDLIQREKTMRSADTLVLAAGRYPELIFMEHRPEVDTGQIGDSTPEDAPFRWMAVQPYKQPGFESEAGLYSKADVNTDFSGAIKAIGAGRRAAASIHQLLYGISPGLPELIVTENSIIQNVYDVENVAPSPRVIMPLAHPKDLIKTGELELGYTEEAARAEAARCLQCGLICYERTVQIQTSVPEDRISA